MAGGILMSLAMWLIGGASAAKDNYEMMKEPWQYLDDGTPVYLDRHCRKHINGELVVPIYNYELQRTQEVGKKSGKVYYDPVVHQQKLKEKESEENKTKAIENGYAAYLKYDFKRQRFITCEISTDKFIAEIESEEDGTFWKYYLDDDANEFNLYQHKSSRGIKITEEEFDKIDIPKGTHNTFDIYRYEYGYDTITRKYGKLRRREEKQK